MTKDLLPHTLLALSLLAPPAAAQDAKSTLTGIARALGADSLSTLQVSGHGSDYVVGQAYDAHSPWPRFNMPSFSMAIDYTVPAMRTERVRAQGDQPARGGALQPLVGEQRLVQVVHGQYAWNQAGTNPTPAGTGAAVRGESPGAGLHAPTAADERRLHIWLTPAGFIKAAIANNATVRTQSIRDVKRTIVSFTTPLKLTLEGTVNEQQVIERIETRIGHPSLGDTLIEAIFLDYRDTGGVKFPSRIIHREGGYAAFDLTVTSVVPNAPVAISVPDSVRQAPAPTAAPLVLQKMADGVWLAPGGSQSVVVEFRDHLVVVDAPVDEERSLTVIAAIRATVPKKPIRYVVNSHIHFDHVGGLRAYVAEGATIVTQQDNIAYLEQILNAPRTLSPDRLAKSGRRPVFEGVSGSRTLSDGARHLVLYHYAGNAHNSGMLMAFLPKERILFEADSFIPGRPGTPHPAVPNLVHFYDAVQRLRLDVEQILPSHGRVATFNDLRETVEASGPVR